jgi:hypothetical protein
VFTRQIEGEVVRQGHPARWLTLLHALPLADAAPFTASSRADLSNGEW